MSEMIEWRWIVPTFDEILASANVKTLQMPRKRKKRYIKQHGRDAYKKEMRKQTFFSLKPYNKEVSMALDNPIQLLTGKYLGHGK